jgi:hypothetical protein
MERGWLETIQMLGVDLQVAWVLLLLLAERLGALFAWLAGVVRTRGRVGRLPAELPSTATPGTAWPPREWRTSH